MANGLLDLEVAKPMTKNEVIGFIMRANSIASRDFLETQPVDELELYLYHILESEMVATPA